MKYFQYLKLKWREIGLVSLILILAFTVFGNSKQESILKPIKEEIVKPEVCEPTYVLQTDDFLKSRDVVILDLSNFELFKTKRIDSKRVGYYYRQTGAEKRYYTVFKNEPKEPTQK